MTGEIYFAADPDLLFAELDAIETFRGFGVAGSLYRRALVRARTMESRKTLAWTYVYTGPREGARVVTSGDWRETLRP